MAYIRRIVSDTEHTLDDILERQSAREFKIFIYYKAARTIQRWFRGYITRKHMKFLHDQATIIQKHWRGHNTRHLYFLLLKKKVKEFYDENYNRLATVIQKTWRGYVYREYVFSYLKLKRWKISIIKKNKFLLQIIKNYEIHTWKSLCNKMEKEAEEWLAYILFKTHHLLRTYRIKGVYSLKNSKHNYSSIEELLRLIKFTKYLKGKRKSPDKHHKIEPAYEYKFQGVYRKCEEAWLQRYTPTVYSVFSCGVYGEEEEIARFNEKQAKAALNIQDERMKFGLEKCKCADDTTGLLDYKPYVCPSKHKSVLNPTKHRSVLTKRESSKGKSEELDKAKIIELAQRIVEEILSAPLQEKLTLAAQALQVVDIIMEYDKKPYAQDECIETFH